jgi:hypothetical protein
MKGHVISASNVMQMNFAATRRSTTGEERETGPMATNIDRLRAGSSDLGAKTFDHLDYFLAVAVTQRPSVKIASILSR